MDAGESRRSARIAGGFWIAVEGVDDELVLRHGDISATGIFFELDADVGEIGTVQWLHVASLDRSRVVSVMAHVVRIVSLEELGGAARAVALEFMPESDEAAANLVDFVRHVLAEPAADGSAPQVSPRVQTYAQGEVPPAPGSETTLKELSVQTLVLETDWSVPVGEPVRVEIIARGVRRPIRVEGHAVSVVSAPAGGAPGRRYRIAVRVDEEIHGPLRRFSSMELRAVDPSARGDSAPPRSDRPIDQLLSALIVPPAEPTERKHLAGELSRIPFTALCSLLELERMSGELSVRRAGGELRLFVRDGRFVDVEPAPTGSPQEAITALLGCRDGTFAFVVTAVTRPDRVAMSMTQLLLEAARQADEAARAGVSS